MGIGPSKKRRWLLLSLAFAGLAFFVSISQRTDAAAGINQQMNFQGRLLNSQGATVPDGYYNIQFKIYQDGDGQSVGNTTGSPAGSLKWTENHLNANSQGVQVKNGYFSVQLGSITAFGSNIDWNQDTLWLSLNIGNTNTSCTPFSSCSPDGEMTPMKRLTANPYALNSRLLGGLSSAQYLQLAQGVQTDASNNTSSIYLNKTGTGGNFLNLQSGGADAFALTGAGDIAFGANADHTISVATAGSGVAGKSLTLSAGAAGTGGSALAGGNLVLQGGAGGGTNGNGGNIVIDAGVKNGSGTDGTISIGTTTASAITIGKVGTTTSIAGNLTVSGTTQGSTINATSALQLNGADINTAGTLSNVAYLDQDQTFSGLNTFENSLLVATDSSTALQVQNNGNYNVLTVATDSDTPVVSLGELGTGPGTILEINGEDGTILTAQSGRGVSFSASGGNSIWADDAAGTLSFGAGGSNENIMINTDGSVVLKNSSDSATAFQIQKADATPLFVVDSTDSRIAIGPSAVPANSILTIGTDTTAATGGMYFGTDTNLYRNAAGVLKTDGALAVVGAITGNTINGATLSATAVNGLNVSGTAISGSGSGLAISAGGTAQNLTLNAATSGQVQIGGTSTGDILLGGGTTGGSGCTLTNSSGNFACNGTINGQTLSSTASFTGTLAVQGANLTIGSGTTVGSLRLNTASTRMVVLQGLDPTGSGNATIQLPSIAGGSTDTVCLQTANNCNTVATSTTSGAQNYLTKYNNAGGTQLIKSLVYDNGTGVSVGGSSPAGLFNVGNSNQFQVSTGGAVTAVGVNSGTGLIQGTGGFTIAGTYTLSSLNSAGVLHTDASGVLSTGAVVLGTETSGDYVASLGTLTGLTAGGNSGEGSTPSLSVTYGNGANTAVQGNTTLTCPSGTGNLSGGGNTITLGTGGTCNALDTIGNPTFAGTITASNSGGVALAVTGTPTASATQSLFRLGSAIAGGNSATNGGTYLGLNAPGSGAGSAADFLNLQYNGVSRFLITNGGAVTQAGALTVQSGGVTIQGGGLSVTGNSTIAGTLGSLTGLTSSGTITFSGLNSAGVVHTNASGQLSVGQVILGTETSGSYVQALGTLTGLTTSGNSGPGTTPTLSVNYGATSTSAVRGDTTLTCPSAGTNLSGGGTSITLGNGGTCGALSLASSPTISGLLTANGGLSVAASSEDTLSVSNSTGTGNIAVFRDNTTAVFTIANEGAVTFKPSTNSTTAFQVQSAGAGSTLLAADTSNMRVNVVGDVNVGTRLGNRLFSDNFESGGFGVWSLGTNGSIATDTSTVRAGKYSARINSSNAAVNAGTTVAANSTVYTRFWVNVASQTSASADLLTVHTTGANYWSLYRNGGAIHVYNSIPDADAGVGGAFTTSGWHLIEVRITTGSGTGTTQVWLNGTQVINATSQQNGTNSINEVRTGTEETDQTFNAYIDDFAVDTVTTGTASSLHVDDSFHVGGTTSFGNSVLIQSTSNNAKAFQVQNAGGTAILSVDTQNSRVGIGTNAPNEALQVNGGINIGSTSNTNAGTIRFNGTDFEGYDGSQWKSMTTQFLSVNPQINVRKSVNECVNSAGASGCQATGTTPQDDDELAFPVGANETWNFRFVLYYNSGTSPDFKVGVTAAGATSCVFGYGDFEGATGQGAVACGTSSNSIAGTNNSEIVEVMGTVVSSGSPITVRVQWAQNSANTSNTTVSAGSFLQANRILSAGDSTLEAFVNNGNSFGGAANIGTNDANALNLRTAGNTIASFGTNGAATFQNSTDSASAFRVLRQGGNPLLNIDATTGAAGNGVVSVGSPVSDANLTLFQPDSYSTFADTATCSASTNQGALYYNTNTSSASLRTCVNGSWQDMASTEGLNALLFGVIPDSGSSPGDLAGVNSSDASDGPCKVYMGSGNNTVRWTGCTVYSNGRKQVIPAQTSDYSTGITTTGNAYQNLCIFTAGSGPTFGTASTTETSASVPTWSATAPALCLATIKQTAGGSGIGAIYDTRIFTTSTKQLATISTAVSPGYAVKVSSSLGQATPVNATTDPLFGVVAAYSGTTQTTAINAIVVTAGPAYVKATAGSTGAYIKPTATSGYVNTSALVTTAQSDIPYNYLGLARSPYNAPGTQCSTTANADTCRGSVFTTINIR